MIEIIIISLFFLFFIIVSKVCEKLFTKKEYIPHFVEYQQYSNTEIILGRRVDFDRKGNIIYMESVRYCSFC